LLNLTAFVWAWRAHTTSPSAGIRSTMLIVVSWDLCSIGTAFSLISLDNLTSMDNTNTKRDRRLGVLLLAVMFQRLLQAEPSVAHKDIVHLFEIEVNMVVMMRILAPVPFTLLLFFSTLLNIILILCQKFGVSLFMGRWGLLWLALYEKTVGGSDLHILWLW